MLWVYTLIFFSTLTLIDFVVNLIAVACSPVLTLSLLASKLQRFEKRNRVILQFPKLEYKYVVHSTKLKRDLKYILMYSTSRRRLVYFNKGRMGDNVRVNMQDRGLAIAEFLFRLNMNDFSSARLYLIFTTTIGKILLIPRTTNPSTWRRMKRRNTIGKPSPKTSSMNYKKTVTCK